jgi:hypothetical protein
MMETAIMAGVLLVVALVMASGVWVGSVLIAAVARVPRPAPSAKKDVVTRAVEPPRQS